MSWHHFGILLVGMIIGGCIGVVIMGALSLAGEQSRAEEEREARRAEQVGTPADDDMLLWAGEGVGGQNPDVKASSRPRPASARAVPELNRGDSV